MVNDLLLLSGSDIPFPEAQITIHQPSIREISLIGEDAFYGGCGLLNFSKDNLLEQDKINLGNLTNFEILMSMILNKRHLESRKSKTDLLLVLALLFPEYKINLTVRGIFLIKGDEVHSINSENFEKFKEILTDMFCLKGSGEGAEPEYNPKGQLAKQIADKFKKRRQKLAEQKGEKKISVLSQYASIVAIGMNLDLNAVLNYTIYQLFDQHERFDLKDQFEKHFQAQLAGARDLKEVDHWKKNIHS